VFPRARFVLLYRDPYAAYRSYRRWRSWYLRWPDDPVREPTRFGRHWRTLVEGFLADHGAIDGLVVRYEDLASGRLAPATLAEHLGLALPPHVELQRVASRPRSREAPLPTPIPDDELALLRSAVDPLARSLGYEPDPG
jgi:hypothetical protein